MNALDKLDAVQIEADSRISETDRQFCEAHQAAYMDAKASLAELEYMWTDIVGRQSKLLKPAAAVWNNVQEYIHLPRFSEQDIRNQLEELNDLFIFNLVRYFKSRYKISLDVGSIIDMLLPHKPKSDYYSPNTEAVAEYYQKLRAMTVDYKDVLEQIFVQLGGRTFLERAQDEIKEACHKAAWCTSHGKAKYELRNDTIQFTNGCHFDVLFEKWKLNDSMKKILRGLAYFETEALGYYPVAISNLLNWSYKEDPVISFSTYTKLQSLRMFKNGRVDVKFKSRDYASRFVSEFLGLVR